MGISVKKSNGWIEGQGLKMTGAGGGMRVKPVSAGPGGPLPTGWIPSGSLDVAGTIFNWPAFDLEAAPATLAGGWTLAGAAAGAKIYYRATGLGSDAEPVAVPQGVNPIATMTTSGDEAPAEVTAIELDLGWRPAPGLTVAEEIDFRVNGNFPECFAGAWGYEQRTAGTMQVAQTRDVVPGGLSVLEPWFYVSDNYAVTFLTAMSSSGDVGPTRSVIPGGTVSINGTSWSWPEIDTTTTSIAVDDVFGDFIASPTGSCYFEPYFTATTPLTVSSGDLLSGTLTFGQGYVGGQTYVGAAIVTNPPVTLTIVSGVGTLNQWNEVTFNNEITLTFNEAPVPWAMDIVIYDGVGAPNILQLHIPINIV